MQFSPDGNYLICSERSGRYIYLIDLTIRRVVAEIYRGRSTCEIRSISMSHDNMYIALITEKSKIHIFYLETVTKSTFNTFIDLEYIEQGQKEQKLVSIMRF